MKENLLIGAIILMLTVLPLSIWFAYRAGFKAGESDCQTNSQSAVIEQQRKLDALLKVAQTKAKDRRRIIDGYERKLRLTDNSGCADNRVPDLRAKRVQRTLRAILR